MFSTQNPLAHNKWNVEKQAKCIKTMIEKKKKIAASWTFITYIHSMCFSYSNSVFGVFYFIKWFQLLPIHCLIIFRFNFILFGIFFLQCNSHVCVCSATFDITENLLFFYFLHRSSLLVLLLLHSRLDYR